MKKKRSIIGFTLIELLVVIAIIGLLLAIIVPSLNKAKYITRRVICAGRLNQIGVAMKLYSEANKDWLPTDRHPDNENTREKHGYVVYRQDWAFSSGKLIPLRFARLYEEDLIDMPELFYCPNNRNQSWMYESYINPAPWGTLPQTFNTTNQWVRIGYTYYPIERNAEIPASGYPEPARKYSKLNVAIPYATDVIHGLKNLSHQYGSSFNEDGTVRSWGTMALNAVYGDGHVTTCTDMSVFKDSVWNAFINQDAGDLGYLYDRSYYVIFKLIGP